MNVTKNSAYLDSLRRRIEQFSDGRPLEGVTVLITGASGMLGKCIIDTLMLWNRLYHANCHVVAISRSMKAAEIRFGRYLKEKNFTFLAQDVCCPLQGFDGKADYIIHAASNADPANMAAYPVDTILANVLGTKNMLDYGIAHDMRRFLFVSSGEVYGQPQASMADFTEDYCGPLDLAATRSCYPEGKRASEVLCQSYISQFDADAVIARPCHLFGPTQTAGDTRAVSQFLRQAAAGQDIVLNSAGALERSHCYVADAVSGILAILTRGSKGEAYNIADRNYQMTIREFAEKAAACGGCRLIPGVGTNPDKNAYSAAKRMVLDGSKLRALGWHPENNTASGIQETIDILRCRGTGKIKEDGGIDA